MIKNLNKFCHKLIPEQVGLNKLEKVIFFNITRVHKSKQKLFSANKVSRCSQNNSQVIKG